MNTEMQRVVDEAAIRRVMCRYARACDRLDPELMRTAYHPGAIEDHGEFYGTVDEFIDWAMPALLARFESGTHFMGQQLVEFEGDDVAWVETYCLALMRTRPDDEGSVIDILMNVRYCDRFERRDGDWRIAHRVVAYEPGRGDALSDIDVSYVMGQRGTRDRNDPAYLRSVGSSPWRTPAASTA
jgi:hypothetical protein